MTEPSDDPTASTPATEPVPEVETAADLGPEATEPHEPAAADPVSTVSRRGAALAMAACLLLGGVLGWLVADNTGDDAGGQLVSEVTPGGGQARGGGPALPGPHGPGGPGGGWHHHGGPGLPGPGPWMGEHGGHHRDDRDRDR